MKWKLSTFDVSLEARAAAVEASDVGSRVYQSSRLHPGVDILIACSFRYRKEKNRTCASDAGEASSACKREDVGENFH